MFKSAALIVVDAQRGFSELCPNELPVPGALAIVPIINKLLTFPWKHVFATQDWHPEDHCSFKAQGGPYPPHCVQNTEGSRFLPGLNQQAFNAIFRKGYYKDHDAPSPFRDHALLKQLHGLDFYLCGICTNICVVETAMDCTRYLPHAPTYIIEDACATLALPLDSLYNPDAMKKKGQECSVEYITSNKLEKNYA